MDPPSLFFVNCEKKNTIWKRDFLYFRGVTLLPPKLVQISNTVVKALGVVGIILFVWSMNHDSVIRKRLVAMVDI